MSDRKALLRAMSEEEVAAEVRTVASLRGWRTAHFRPAQLRNGSWRTPVEGSAKGFPDWLLLRGATLLVWELKSQQGRLSVEQREWLHAFSLVTRVEAAVVRPSNLEDARTRLLR